MASIQDLPGNYFCVDFKLSLENCHYALTDMAQSLGCAVSVYMAKLEGARSYVYMYLFLILLHPYSKLLAKAPGLLFGFLSANLFLHLFRA